MDKTIHLSCAESLRTRRRQAPIYFESGLDSNIRNRKETAKKNFIEQTVQKLNAKFLEVKVFKNFNYESNEHFVPSKFYFKSKELNSNKKKTTEDQRNENQAIETQAIETQAIENQGIDFQHKQENSLSANDSLNILDFSFVNKLLINGLNIDAFDIIGEDITF